ncbi:MAG: YraN family protein [Deltaproteobacteria bacterium]|nr:YraN family protein [Deltaproteobacteria bacterium]
MTAKGAEPKNRSDLGGRGEDLAVGFLKAKGYTILERNFRSSVGEIDIVAQEAQTLVFVEVKTRETDGFGSAKWAVDQKKRRKVSMAALAYLNQKARGERPARFDVVAVDITNGKPRIELYRNAFELAY